MQAFAPVWGKKASKAALLGGGRGLGGQELAELDEIVVRTRDHMDGDNFAERAGGSGAGFNSGFHGGDIATHEDADVARADFFPADQFDVGCFEHRVGCFKLSDEAFGFDGSECLSCHNKIERLEVLEVAFWD